MALDTLATAPGSFRDPAGQVYQLGSRVFRTLSEEGLTQYRQCREILEALVSDGRVLPFSQVRSDEVDLLSAGGMVLEHPRLEIWTMPYEWSFAMLKDAALFHLDLHLYLLDHGFTLSDASAYNVQFVGTRPVFIDHLSVRKYRDGEFWLGHRQFCEQFLNPLLFRAYLDIAPNAWYRGNLEGIPIDAMARLLPARRKYNWKALSNIVLPAAFQRRNTSEREASASIAGRTLPLAGLKGMLRQLRSWIDGLFPADASPSTWANYAVTTTYDDEETRAKKDFVAEFVQQRQIRTLIDLGCNTGDYSKISLESGAEAVVGFDFDQQAIDTAHRRAKAEGLNFQALFLDARNPSPSQGWMQSERLGFEQRFSADAVLALAFEHHLAIAHNVPLDQVVRWITSLAPAGVLEFVPKSDPTVVKMLALREDIFPDYSEEAFEKVLRATSRVERKQQVTASGRVLFAYQR